MGCSEAELLCQVNSEGSGQEKRPVRAEWVQDLKGLVRGAGIEPAIGGHELNGSRFPDSTSGLLQYFAFFGLGFRSGVHMPRTMP